LKDILDIQLADNVKARWLDNELQNEYKRDPEVKIRSQIEIYNYLYQKAMPFEQGAQATVTAIVAEM